MTHGWWLTSHENPTLQTNPMIQYTTYLIADAHGGLVFDEITTIYSCSQVFLRQTLGYITAQECLYPTKSDKIRR